MGFVVFLVILGLGYYIGTQRETKHFASLDQRELALGDFAVIQRSLPDDAEALGLVTGGVVIASDALKSFKAVLKGIVGGELPSLETLMERARRESLLRAIEQAQSMGADGVCNVRYETATLGPAGRQGAGPSELLCYATAIRRTS